jgi:prepilin-type processing-associated H-X9-DG protein
MQFRLSTLFLIVFVVAASMAAFGGWGIMIAAAILPTALYVNHCETLRRGIRNICVVVFLLGIIACILLQPHAGSYEASKRAQCSNNLKQIGIALCNYQDQHKHFPAVSTSDQNGKPLFSWRERILPQIEWGPLYDQLRQDEPWDSPYNAQICGQIAINFFQCPSANHGKNDCTTNYLAVIGPGTAWRKEGPVKLSDLPDGGAHTVMAVEVANSGVHWAEPRELTVEEALAGLKADFKGKARASDENKPEPRISSDHPGKINVLFADSKVLPFPQEMPLPLWEKLFAGEVKDVDALSDQFYSKPPEPSGWPLYLSLLVWLLSVILLFRRAVKSRRKPAAAEGVVS